MAVQLEKSWNSVLSEEFDKPYMKSLKDFLTSEKHSGKTIYPSGSNIFNAFKHTPFDEVKVVILGQDPYHGANQAHGLSFSVKKGVPIPPSLRNIFKELMDDIPDFRMPGHGDLTHWADQGVLLLNATLTVRASEAGSHQKKGWETFTDEAIKALAEKRQGIVFLLWGRYAQSKAALIDESKHYILTAPHPSPLAQGFNGCRHFSRTNEYLVKTSKAAINWHIT